MRTDDARRAPWPFWIEGCFDLMEEPALAGLALAGTRVRSDCSIWRHCGALNAGRLVRGVNRSRPLGPRGHKFARIRERGRSTCQGASTAAPSLLRNCVHGKSDFIDRFLG